MDWIDRKQIGEELLNNMDLTKEQYLEFVRLAEEMDLEYEYGYKLPEDAEMDLQLGGINSGEEILQKS